MLTMIRVIMPLHSLPPNLSMRLPQCNRFLSLQRNTAVVTLRPGVAAGSSLASQAVQCPWITVGLLERQWDAAVANGTMSQTEAKEAMVKMIMSAGEDKPGSSLKVVQSLMRYSPQTLWANAQGLQTVVGEQWLPLIRRNQSLLKSPPETLSGAWEVLREISHGDDVAAMAIVDRNPDVLLGRASTMRRAWQVLLQISQGGSEAAMLLVHHNASLLRSQSVSGVWNALQNICNGDRKVARSIVKAGPSVLTARPIKITSGWAELVNICNGDREAAIEIVRHSPSVLRSTTISTSWSVLTDITGGDSNEAMTIVKQCPEVLRSNAMGDAWRILLHISDADHQGAFELVKQSPAVIVVPPRTMEGAWRVLQDISGGDSETAQALVRMFPNILRSPGTTVRGSWNMLLEIVGADSDAAMTLVQRSPSILRCPGSTIAGAWGAWTEICGKEDAMTLVEKSLGNLKISPRKIWPKFEALVEKYGEKEARALVLSRGGLWLVYRT